MPAWVEGREYPREWIALSRYAIRRGDYTISKSMVRGEWRYLVFHEQKLLPVTYGTSTLAKAYVDALEAKK